MSNTYTSDNSGTTYVDPATGQLVTLTSTSSSSMPTLPYPSMPTLAPYIAPGNWSSSYDMYGDRIASALYRDLLASINDGRLSTEFLMRLSTFISEVEHQNNSRRNLFRRINMFQLFTWIDTLANHMSDLDEMMLLEMTSLPRSLFAKCKVLDVYNAVKQWHKQWTKSGVGLEEFVLKACGD